MAEQKKIEKEEELEEGTRSDWREVPGGGNIG
jgi:hypothetical protein